ncbi:MAG: hypothetical protein IPI59_04635 [Sphingobacteriales bacterium]|nr:hypothetical protein [Sphingobacteriales bacterium]MCC7057497.1 hypothetical protein [Chitinophagales bacterium]MDA0199995.1 hypothetical protein [Bacteroidota bacterium]MBK6891331.1 hypothetical protein [Sphingobacteriales bacterium]MBK7526837.1 hypothetical protein [Sphingobacteriales bacterium]
MRVETQSKIRKNDKILRDFVGLILSQSRASNNLEDLYQLELADGPN